SLAPDLTGSPPLQFSWKKSGVTIPGCTSSSLLMTNVSLSDSADYTVSVTNDLGNVSATLPLRVVIPPQCELAQIPSGLRLIWSSVTGQLYTVEEAVAVTGPWVAWTNSIIGNGQTNSLDFA